MTGPVGDAVLLSLGFRPHEIPGFFRLPDPERDSEERTRSAVRALRTMGHSVDTDPQFDVPGTAPLPSEAPDVAFARHPDLGIVAAVADGIPIHPGVLLTQAGWQHRTDLDLYYLSPSQPGEELDAVAVATARLQRGRYTTAVQPDLAHAVAMRGTDTRERIRVTLFPGAHARLASLSAQFRSPAGPAAQRGNTPAANASAPPRSRSR
ncbi:hypothetical protein GCM10009759_17670 [Kitasatospora saccharophila]|uniref:Uncharacterized protein n=1 Tax=Kitasatospora saccharophila TaxID=407973 RepID=A0ABP5I447_9ACTN